MPLDPEPQIPRSNRGEDGVVESTLSRTDRVAARSS